jgi:hypothetical protein
MGADLMIIVESSGRGGVDNAEAFGIDATDNALRMAEGI